MPIEINGALETPLRNLVEKAAKEYPYLWERVIDEWRTGNNEDAAWLTYSANYLFRTTGIHWALDPYFLLHRIGIPHTYDLSQDLSKLELVVLSHAHNDHFDLKLIHALRDLPIHWVVPEFMLELAVNQAGLHRDRIIIPQPGSQFTFKGLSFTPFNGLHFNEGHGISEIGYLVEFNRRRWLFPGDVRRYDISVFPRFGELDGVFAHLWLGKGCALQENPPLLDEFHTFFSRLNPTRLVITHMQEIGREKEELWDLHHYTQVLHLFQQNKNSIELQPALTGQKIIL